MKSLDIFDNALENKIENVEDSMSKYFCNYCDNFVEDGSGWCSKSCYKGRNR